MNDTLKRCGIAALLLSLMLVAPQSADSRKPYGPQKYQFSSIELPGSRSYSSVTVPPEPSIDVRIEVIRDSRALVASSKPALNPGLEANPSPMWETKSTLSDVDVHTDRHTASTGRHAVRGSASWYCKAGVSVCHYKYPPGSMVAAACGKLRAAMGSWRGKTVSVSSGRRTVSVKLVDWCGSRSKLIDLYWEPMRRLGGSGVLPVTVRW